MPASATTKFYAYISAAWVELDDAGTAGTVRCLGGMSGNSPLDRVADTGELRVSLNNSAGLYTPGGPSALAGFVKGIAAKMVVTFENEDYTWYYYIKDIDPKPSNKDKKCELYLVSWLDYAQRHQIVNPGIQTSKRGDEVLTTAIADSDVAPRGTDFDTGMETFDTAFDTVTSHTTIYSEMSKVAFSELGYVYEKKDGTIVFEAADARPGSRTVDTLPVANVDAGAMLKEDESYLLLENGGKILINSAAATALDGNVITDYKAPYGDHVINKMTVYAYPRRLDTSAQVLFSLDKEIKITPGKSYTIKGTYADPAGGLPINAQDMITPQATTDYTMYTATGGGGSSITADLSVSITYGTEGFTAVLTNNNAAKGFVNKFQTRGTGIYLYNPVSHEASNAASADSYGAESETLHQKYKTELDAGRIFVDSQVEQFKDPRTVLTSIAFCANTSPACMMAFLNGEVGQLHYLDIDELGITGNYYIQGIEFQMNGKIIMVTWIVTVALSLLTGCGLTPIAIQTAAASEDMVNFGYLPRTVNLSTRTFSVWVYPTSAALGSVMGLMDGNDLGSRIRFDSDRKVTYIKSIHPTGMPDALQSNAWTTTETLTLNAWHLIVVTQDVTATPATDPIVYLDASVATLTNSSPVAGTTVDETTQPLQIGNMSTPSTDYLVPFPGKIFDPRIYNTILTQANVTTLYNSGSPSALVGPTSGLVFQAFAVRSGDTASYVDQTLTSSTNLFDAQFKAVGTIHGAPVGRAAP